MINSGVAIFCHFSVVQMSIQTETVKPHLPSGPKILKNKALLCRPLVQNKGVSCKTQTADVEAQTGKKQNPQTQSRYANYISTPRQTSRQTAASGFLVFFRFNNFYMPQL